MIIIEDSNGLTYLAARVKFGASSDVTDLGHQDILIWTAEERSQWASRSKSGSKYASTSRSKAPFSKSRSRSNAPGSQARSNSRQQSRSNMRSASGAPASRSRSRSNVPGSQARSRSRSASDLASRARSHSTWGSRSRSNAPHSREQSREKSKSRSGMRSSSGSGSRYRSREDSASEKKSRSRSGSKYGSGSRSRSQLGGGCVPSVTDAFNRADETPLAGEWSVTANFNLSGNKVVEVNGGATAIYEQAPQCSDDHYAQITVLNSVYLNFLSVMVRLDCANVTDDPYPFITCYIGRFMNAGPPWNQHYYAYRVVDGGETQIGSQDTDEVPTVLQVKVYGANPATIDVINQNGVKLSRTDSEIDTGRRVGFKVEDGSGSNLWQLDDFTSQDL